MIVVARVSASLHAKRRMETVSFDETASTVRDAFKCTCSAPCLVRSNIGCAHLGAVIHILWGVRPDGRLLFNPLSPSDYTVNFACSKDALLQAFIAWPDPLRVWEFWRNVGRFLTAGSDSHV